MNKVKTLLILSVALSSVSVMAQDRRYASRTSADESFMAVPKDTPSVIRWVVVDDPDAECRAARGDSNKDFARRTGGEIKACARYTNKSCTIITGPETSHAILGHELRHCFEGKFHD